MPKCHNAIPDDSIAPGETTVSDITGITVAIANADGEFFEYANLCPHQVTPLGEQPSRSAASLAVPSTTVSTTSGAGPAFYHRPIGLPYLRGILSTSEAFPDRNRPSAWLGSTGS
jgi:hypothetical protein